MGKAVSRFALAAGISLALAFTFSCSGDSGDEQSGGSDLSDLIKLIQIYLVEDRWWDGTVVKTAYKGNSYIFALRDINDETSPWGYITDTLSTSKIEGGQLSLNLPENMDSKYLEKLVFCESEYWIFCETDVVAPPDLFVGWIDFDGDLNGRGGCGTDRLNLIKSGERIGWANFDYASKSGKVTGTMTGQYIDEPEIEKYKYNLNLSKGWNLVYYIGGNGEWLVTTDLPANTKLEWWWECGGLAE